MKTENNKLLWITWIIWNEHVLFHCPMHKRLHVRYVGLTSNIQHVNHARRKK